MTVHSVALSTTPANSAGEITSSITSEGINDTGRISRRASADELMAAGTIVL